MNFLMATLEQARYVLDKGAEMNLIDTAFAYLGYVKIEHAAVKISLSQETFFEKLISLYKEKSDTNSVEVVEHYRLQQKALTDYLRSCRLLTYNPPKRNQKLPR